MSFPRPVKHPPPPSLPRRGRHDLGLARISLRRVVVSRGGRPQAHERMGPRFDRRREQLPLPPGFADRRERRG
jgi:hypothetical protein